MVNVDPTRLIEIQDQSVTGLLESLRSFGDSPAPTLAQIGDAMVQSTRLRFDQGVSPEGAAWKPLAMATLIKRAARGRSMRRGGPLFKNGGGMRAAFQRAVAGNAKPLMDTRQHLYQTLSYQVRNDGVRWGVSAAWGAIHQFGGMAGRGRKVYIPARPYLGMSIADRSEVVAILTRDVLARAQVAA